jgi:FkbH-like protein
MHAVVSPFTAEDLPRIAQLVGKTNQFNLTTRRHPPAVLREFAEDPTCVHLTFRLGDRFTDHGLVAVVIAFHRGAALELDTWLMSCRVIGRSLEATVLQELCRAAGERGCTELRASYVPSAKNELVRDLFPKLGFEPVDEHDGTTHWIYDLTRKPRVVNEFIDVAREEKGSVHDGA